jgi:hypothetical protein
MRRKHNAQLTNFDVSSFACYRGRSLLGCRAFPIPAIDRNAWWLQVEGDVEKPFAIMLLQRIEALRDALREMSVDQLKVNARDRG